MEYRVRYRDIPWFVAIGVLPGKIIGTFFIKPWLRFRRNWKSITRRWVERFALLCMVLAIVGAVLGLVNHLTDGRLILEMEAVIQTTPAPEPAIVDLATPAEIIGNHR